MACKIATKLPKDNAKKNPDNATILFLGHPDKSYQQQRLGRSPGGGIKRGIGIGSSLVSLDSDDKVATSANPFGIPR